MTPQEAEPDEGIPYLLPNMDFIYGRGSKSFVCSEKWTWVEDHQNQLVGYRWIEGRPGEQVDERQAELLLHQTKNQAARDPDHYYHFIWYDLEV